MSSSLRGVQQNLDFEVPAAKETEPQCAPLEDRPSEQPHERLVEQVERIASTQRFIAAAVVEIRKNLPMQRRPLSERTRNLHVQAVLTRRNGLCPCCQETTICNADGKLPGAEFDHWYSRSQNRPQQTWLVCEECNRQLRNHEFKAAARSAFESYQQALRPFLVGRQESIWQARHTA